MAMRRTGFPQEVVELILARSGGNCEVMATGCTLIAEQVHHRRPRGMGGSRQYDTNTAANGLGICRRCHNRVESLRTWARDNGFVVGQHEHPADVPVWWRCNTSSSPKQFSLLDDSGGRRAVTAERSAS